MEVLLDKLERESLLSPDQRSVVEFEHRLSGESLDSLLVDSGFVSIEHLQRHRIGYRHIAIEADDFVPDASAVDLLEEGIARRYGILPLCFDATDSRLTVAISRADDVLLRDRIERAVPETISLCYRLASEADIAAALDRCYGLSLSLDEILTEFDCNSSAEGHDDGSYRMPIVRLVDTILRDAVNRQASDIHLSPEERFVRIRYRVDGVLVPIRCLHKHYWSAMVVRIKVLCAMDIAEIRLPQDGHMSRRINGERVDFRVSTFPVRTGENLVLRVLDRRRGQRRLNELEIPIEQQHALQELIALPQGMVVVCGPTGCGKTTTLYALLGERDDDSRNIMTLEDPVEYPMLRVRQTSINLSHQLDYANGVRSLLRQDPDILLIGEVRDSDSCAMAFRASMSGHQVLTTVHAGNTVKALQRLIELGVAESVLVNHLNGIVAQRLLRRTCTHCHADDAGCMQCAGTGYKGRFAVLEILTVTPQMAEQLLAGIAIDETQLACCLHDRCTLEQSAKRYVASGETTQAEFDRVFGKRID